MQWVQNPSQRKAENLKTVRREARRYLRKEKEAYLKSKIETNNKIKNVRDLCRGINDFKKS
jgi:hypothetical protein